MEYLWPILRENKMVALTSSPHVPLISLNLLCWFIWITQPSQRAFHYECCCPAVRCQALLQAPFLSECVCLSLHSRFNDVQRMLGGSPLSWASAALIDDLRNDQINSLTFWIKLSIDTAPLIREALGIIYSTKWKRCSPPLHPAKVTALRQLLPWWPWGNEIFGSARLSLIGTCMGSAPMLRGNLHSCLTL